MYDIDMDCNNYYMFILEILIFLKLMGNTAEFLSLKVKFI
jgi:hypothetical protein